MTITPEMQKIAADGLVIINKLEGKPTRLNDTLIDWATAKPPNPHRAPSYASLAKEDKL
jgi:hypothetical protein